MKNLLKPNHAEVLTISNFMRIHALSWVVLLGMTNGGMASDDDPLFKITTRRDDDQVVVSTDKNTVVVDVKSPVGLSQAIIERKGDHWPANVMLRLHLQGLERLQVIEGDRRIEASVSSQNGTTRIRKDSVPLDAKHAYWMGIRKLSKDGKSVQAIPSNKGSFEIRLPKALFENNPNSITIKWVDFFR
jgi:hypothetical protein